MVVINIVVKYDEMSDWSGILWTEGSGLLSVLYTESIIVYAAVFDSKPVM